MALVAGSRLGVYEVLAPLGAGGMGEVYRAKDTRLGRLGCPQDATVLDFGLAKPLAAPAADAAPGATHSPTVMTSPAMTLHGVILGTAAYMAPEQARGRPVDRRAGIRLGVGESRDARRA